MECTSSIGTSRMLLASVLLAVVILFPLLGAHAQSESHSIGVAPYVPPKPTLVRLVFGYGGNAGLNGLTPSSFIGNASYELGRSVLTAGFVLSDNSISSILPRRNYYEFDLMYGISFDALLPRYEGPFDGLHTSLSAGVSFDSYESWWRPYGHRGYFFLYPPPTIEYSLGFPVQLQAIYEPLRIMGIGAGIGALLFYNVSGFSPSYGGAIVVEATY